MRPSRTTVRRLIPSRRARSRCETPSAASVLTCAHSTALRTSSLLARHRDRAAQPQQGGGRDQRRGEWCTFRLPILAQYWAAGVMFWSTLGAVAVVLAIAASSASPRDQLVRSNLASGLRLKRSFRRLCGLPPSAR